MQFAQDQENRKKYKLRPKIGERVKPLEVKTIISEILKDELDGVKILHNVPEMSKLIGNRVKK